MKKILRYKRICLLGLIPISFLLIILAKKNNYFAEEIYAKHIYKWISQIISSITGMLPFSLGEIMVIVVPIILLVVFLGFIIKMIVLKENRMQRGVKAILNVMCTGSIVLFAFTLFAGINYYRSPFGTYSNLTVRESSAEELYTLTESLALKANELREQTPQTDDNGVFKLLESNYKLAKIANKAYSNLGKEYPILGGYYGSPKPVLLSELMSSTEITGVFFPFTMEANVNVDVPDYTIPATMLHELAHLRGFMREDEANYLAYLAGVESDNVEIQYSSTMLALAYAGNALYDQSPDLYFEIRDRYSEGVLKDIRANADYWVKYEDTVISAVSNKINDTYLKVNDQSDGVKSYGRMLDLLLAKYRKDHKLE